MTSEIFICESLEQTSNLVMYNIQVVAGLVCKTSVWIYDQDTFKKLKERNNINRKQPPAKMSLMGSRRI